jgi:hypothetical protein
MNYGIIHAMSADPDPTPKNKYPHYIESFSSEPKKTPDRRSGVLSRPVLGVEPAV